MSPEKPCRTISTNHPIRLFSVILFLLCLTLPATLAAERSAVGQTQPIYTAVWSEQPPYQQLSAQQNASGLDITLLGTIAKQAGIGIRYEYQSFADGLDQLATGDAAIMPGAYASAERAEFAHISTPYRTGRDRLFLGPKAEKPVAQKPAELIQTFTSEQGPLAVVRDFDWGDEVAEAIEQAAEHDAIVFTHNLNESVQAVINGQAAGFIGDQLAGMAVAHAQGMRADRIHPLVLQERDIHLLLSRAVFDQQTFAKINQTLQRLKQDGTLDTINRQFNGPMAVSIALDRDWFNGLVIFGIIAFSISGVVIARTGGYSIFGAIVLATLPALGGGVIRDILLLREMYLYQSPHLLIICLVVIALGYVYNRFLDSVRGRALWFFDLVMFITRLKRRFSPNLVMQFFDALGLAAFTVVAVSIVAEENIQPLWLWGPVFAAITASGGVILRDMIRNNAINPYLHNVFWGEAAIIWALLLSLYLQMADADTTPANVFTAILLTMIGIFATRMIFVLLNWRAPRY